MRFMSDRILIRSSQPGILPRHGNVLIVSAEANIGAIAVAGLNRLVFADGEGDRASDARARLFGREVLYAAQARDAPPPEVPVERQPQARLQVVTQMPLQGTDRRFILWFGDRARERCLVCGVEPPSSIAIEHPMAQAFGIAKFRFESPPIATPVDQFRAAVLSSGRDHSQTQSQQPLLLPLSHLLRLHRGAADQVHGKPKAGIREARAVYRPGLP